MLFDGDCGFCAASVRFALRHDRRGALRFAPLQGRFGRRLRGDHPALDAVDSMIWYEAAPRPRLLVRSDAALRLAAYLGGVWRLALIGYAVPRSIRDGIYGFVARHRHRLPGAGEAACVLPSESERERFLD
jgi:predicted DCC family thiol-disulfide oxidoreductase YuxK